jgi:hypothetical protein
VATGELEADVLAIRQHYQELLDAMREDLDEATASRDELDAEATQLRSMALEWQESEENHARRFANQVLLTEAAERDIVDHYNDVVEVMHECYRGGLRRACRGEPAQSEQPGDDPAPPGGAADVASTGSRGSRGGSPDAASDPASYDEILTDVLAAIEERLGISARAKEAKGRRKFAMDEASRREIKRHYLRKTAMLAYYVEQARSGATGDLPVPEIVFGEEDDNLKGNLDDPEAHHAGLLAARQVELQKQQQQQQDDSTKKRTRRRRGSVSVAPRRDTADSQPTADKPAPAGGITTAGQLTLSVPDVSLGGPEQQQQQQQEMDADPGPNQQQPQQAQQSQQAQQAQQAQQSQQSQQGTLRPRSRARSRRGSVAGTTSINAGETGRVLPADAAASQLLAESGAVTRSEDGQRVLITRPSYLVGHVLAAAPAPELNDTDIDAVIRRAVATRANASSMTEATGPLVLGELAVPSDASVSAAERASIHSSNDATGPAFAADEAVGALPQSAKLTLAGLVGDGSGSQSSLALLRLEARRYALSRRVTALEDDLEREQAARHAESMRRAFFEKRCRTLTEDGDGMVANCERLETELADLAERLAACESERRDAVATVDAAMRSGGLVVSNGAGGARIGSPSGGSGRRRIVLLRVAGG